ncbi:hypothetical protein LCGC14_1182150 [marine sediment metagenome]|uniref:Uncharacterized protein n=1 Tax=marine sediment metagenome TaxID=412755 RepID=A0A0F9PS97_9ZZZZ
MNDSFAALPLDVQRQWFNVIRRFQSVAKSKKVQNVAVIQMNVVIDENGTPIVWTEPRCTLIEPAKNNRDLLRILTEVL